MKFLSVTVYEVCQLIIGLARLVLQVFRKKDDSNKPLDSDGYEND